MKLITVILLNLFAYLTIRLRPKLFGVDLFKPMIWNFKLSILPFGIIVLSAIIFLVFGYLYSFTGLLVLNYIGKILGVAFLLIWILALPNWTYLITELNLTHREMDKREVPLWYDIVSILSFALSGIINTVLNINIIQYFYLIVFDPTEIRRKDKVFFYITAIIINTLMSIGVYLGRYIRFNSWDILKPSKFIKILRDYFKVEGNIKDSILFIIFHTSFFLIVYFLFNANSLLFS